MTMQFGQLSFMKGGQPVVGLPLDVISKVGDKLTEKYYNNRSSYVKMGSEVLNLSDVDNENNRKIIDGKYEEIKSKFQTFKDKDNWDMADDAIMDTAIKFMEDQDVKDLQKHAALKNQTDKAIEESKAPDIYKQARRAKNKQTYKGIRDENGNALNYSGSALQGDLDFTKYYKQVNDLLTGFKEDKRKIDLGLVQVTRESIGSMSEGFQMVYNKQGSRTISEVSEDEVRALAFNVVNNDPKFQAELAEVAELNLYMQTGKLKPDAKDVSHAMLREAANNPTTMVELIASSDEYATDTAKMNDKQKMEYINKIMSDDKAKLNYLSKGVNRTILNAELMLGKNSDVYSDIYTNFTRKQVYKGFESLVGKFAGIEDITDMKYSESSLNSKMIEKWTGKQSMPMVYESGQMNMAKYQTFVDSRPALVSNYNASKAKLLNAEKGLKSGVSVPNIEQLRKEVSVAEEALNTNDYIIDNSLKNLGYTKSLVLDENKNEVFNIIRGVYREKNLNKPSAGSAIVRGQMPYRTISVPTKEENEEMSKVYSAISKNPEDIQKIGMDLRNQGIVLSNSELNLLFRQTNKILDNKISDIFDKNKDKAVSLPIMKVGWFGDDSVENKDMRDFYLSNRGKGLFNVLQSSKGRTGTDIYTEDNSEQSMNKYLSKENGVGIYKDMPVDIKPVIFMNTDTHSSSLTGFEITTTDPTTGNSNTELVQYTGSTQPLRGIFQSNIENSSISALKDNNHYGYMANSGAYVLAGTMAGGLETVKVGDQSVKDLSLGHTLMTLPKNNNGEYPNVITKYGEAPLCIRTFTNSSGLITSVVYVGTTTDGQELTRLDNAVNPTVILQNIGGIMSSQSAKSKEGLEAISKVFNLYPKSK